MREAGGARAAAPGDADTRGDDKGRSRRKKIWAARKTGASGGEGERGRGLMVVVVMRGGRGKNAKSEASGMCGRREWRSRRADRNGRNRG